METESFFWFIPVSRHFWSFAEKIIEIENTVCIGLENGLFRLVVSCGLTPANN